MNTFVWRASRALAARLKTEAGDNTDAQIKRAFRLVNGRPPRPAEAEAAKRLVDAEGVEALAWVLFNANEFVTVR